MSNSAKKIESGKVENPLYQQNVMNAFCTGLKDTLEMMAQVEINFEKPTVELTWNKVGDISGVIDFDTTDFKGQLYIHFPSKVLIQLYNQMVGENSTEVTPEVIDCIGEISNMAYGVAKGKLDPLKLKFSMSLPKTFKATDLVRLNTVPHLRIPFLIFGQISQVEITLSKK